MSYDCCDCFRPCTQASQHGRDQTGWLCHQTTFQLTGETNSSWCIVGHVTAEFFFIVPAEIFCVWGISVVFHRNADNFLVHNSGRVLHF